MPKASAARLVTPSAATTPIAAGALGPSKRPGAAAAGAAAAPALGDGDALGVAAVRARDGAHRRVAQVDKDDGARGRYGHARARLIESGNGVYGTVDKGRKSKAAAREARHRAVRNDANFIVERIGNKNKARIYIVCDTRRLVEAS